MELKFNNNSPREGFFKKKPSASPPSQREKIFFAFLDVSDHLEAKIKCFSNVSQGSTSSGWSWPTHHEDPRQLAEEGDDGAGGMLEVGMDGSRRYSHLPPAKVERAKC